MDDNGDNLKTGDNQNALEELNVGASDTDERPDEAVKSVSSKAIKGQKKFSLTFVIILIGFTVFGLGFGLFCVYFGKTDCPKKICEEVVTCNLTQEEYKPDDEKNESEEQDLNNTQTQQNDTSLSEEKFPSAYIAGVKASELPAGVVDSLKRYGINLETPIAYSWLARFSHENLHNISDGIVKMFFGVFEVDEYNAGKFEFQDDMTGRATFSYNEVNDLFHEYYETSENLQKKNYDWDFLCLNSSAIYDADGDVFHLVKHVGCGGSVSDKVFYKVKGYSTEGDSIRLELISVVFTPRALDDESERVLDSLDSFVVNMKKRNEHYILVSTE